MKKRRQEEMRRARIEGQGDEIVGKMIEETWEREPLDWSYSRWGSFLAPPRKARSELPTGRVYRAWGYTDKDALFFEVARRSGVCCPLTPARGRIRGRG